MLGSALPRRPIRVLRALAWRALLGALLAACGGPAPVERVVLVTVDTLRADHVGCYGADQAHTPHMDALAAEGVRFANAISPAPLTLPSHASIMTGLTPPHHGVRDNSIFRVPDDLPTLAERFRAGGFATAAFVGAVVLDRQYGLARGFDVYDDQMSLRRAAGSQSFAERTADEVVDAALAWLEDAPPRFLLWVHFYDPHANYEPPPGFAAAFPSNPYAGEIAFVDAQLGRLLEAVGARHPGPRTVFLLTSDHGESLGEHGEVTHALTIYDATQRVPMLLAGGGLPPGRVVEWPVALVDVAPTLLALAGLEALPASQGRNLRSAVEGEPDEERWIYLETLGPQTYFGWSPLQGLRSSREKFVMAPRPELYDLAEDPQETEDLAAERPERVAALEAHLARELDGARGAAPGLAPDADTRAQLEALGYVVSAEAAARPGFGSIGGPDPKDQMPILHTVMKGMTLVNHGRYEDALALLDPLDGAGELLETTRALAAVGLERWADAERYARAAVAARPEAAGAHVVLGVALLSQGRFEEAERALLQAQGLDAAASGPVVGLARLAEARGDRAKALALYEQAVSGRAGSAEALWRAAALHIEAGEIEAADTLLGELPPESPLEPEAAVRLAEAEHRAGLAARARRRLEESVALHPFSSPPRRLLDRLRSETASPTPPEATATRR